MYFKGGTEVGEVVPCGVGRDETPGDIETGTVVNGEQENLFGRSGPPLVNRAVMLPEVADFGAAEPPVGAGFAFGCQALKSERIRRTKSVGSR